MKTNEVEQIRTCLSERIMYPYYKDRYAIDLLRYQFRDKTPISVIKKSGFSGLLNKPVAKEITSQFGDGKLDHDVLRAYWTDKMSYLSLTTGTWGEEHKGKLLYDYDQVSRPEKNLVLQVNFGKMHDILFYKSIGKWALSHLNLYGHPVNDKYCTLGWIRMDIDLDRNEVLIEEVQSDWLRHAVQLKDKLECEDDCCRNVNAKGSQRAVDEYYRFLKQYSKQYQEILLSSALYFIYEELGIKNIWYHTYESGIHYKLLKWSYPPTSVYRQLPEKFGFQKTKEKPQLIENCAALKKLNKTARALDFYYLKLEK